MQRIKLSRPTLHIDNDAKWMKAPVRCPRSVLVSGLDLFSLLYSIYMSVLSVPGWLNKVVNRDRSDRPDHPSPSMRSEVK